MSNMQATWTEIWGAITRAETIKIYRHVNPDPDAYGAQFGLAQMIKNNFPQKMIETPGQKVPRLGFIYENWVFEEDITTKDTLIIVVDTANQERIDGQIDLTSKQIIKIDHHPNKESYGSLQYVCEQMPATCSILLKHFIEMEQKGIAQISTEVLEKLYVGILGDTGNFSYGLGLNQAFFKDVGYLFERIDQKQVLHQFFRKTMEEVKFKGYFASIIEQASADFYVVEFTSQTVQKASVSLDFATSLVNVMGEISGAEVWATFCEDFENENIRCSLRSRYQDISKVAEKFGGGGHKNASGVKVKSWEDVKQIKQAIKELLENNV
ncbi:MAG: DHH family phosphoesterase [Culicoidibacterales bacterium]